MLAMRNEFRRQRISPTSSTPCGDRIVSTLSQPYFFVTLRRSYFFDLAGGCISSTPCVPYFFDTLRWPYFFDALRRLNLTRLFKAGTDC